MHVRFLIFAIMDDRMPLRYFSRMPKSEPRIRPDYRRIYAAVAAIPPGRVASYGEIAARAGLPGRARLAGRALSETPKELDLPWHRIVRADGRIACRSRGMREQARRLRAEGVEVCEGRVRMSAHGLHHDIDSALWSWNEHRPLKSVPAPTAPR